MPPYREAEETMCPPFSARLNRAIVSAAWPLRDRERTDSAVERGHAILEDRLCRVHDPGVDVARASDSPNSAAACAVSRNT